MGIAWEQKRLKLPAIAKRGGTLAAIAAKGKSGIIMFVPSGGIF